MTTVGTSSVPCLASGPSRGHSGDVLAIVAPGQGAQKPGFLSDWMSDATFSDHLAWLSAVADIDLVTHGTTSDEATIKDTAVAQPLLVAAALATAWSVVPRFSLRPTCSPATLSGRLPLALLLGLSLPKPPWFLCASAVGPWPRPRHALPPP